MIYLNVPFNQKDEAKRLGASWDWNAKKWYIDEIQDSKPFERWLPAKHALSYTDLSPEQQTVIDTAMSGKNILVDACIGSGKTTTIQTLCNAMQDKQILYLTYNTLLKEDAQCTITSPNTYVTNYHGFALHVLGDSCNDPNNSVRQFAKDRPVINEHYDVLILDEYQDINEEIAEELKLIKEQFPTLQIIAVGDMEQKIYTNTIINARGFINSFLGEYEQLSFTRCFRLGANHAAHLSKLWNKPIVGVNQNCTVTEMEIEDVVDYLAGYEPKDILCLGERNGAMVKVLNEIESKYPDKFNKNTVYASIRDEDRVQNKNRNSSAIFTTFDGAKGMERKVCVVFDYTEEYWEKRIQKPDSEYTVLRNLFLVAMSRGKEKLILTKGYDRFGEKHFLSDETITTVVNQKYKHKDPFNVSDMFDFNYSEDIKRCMDLIKISPVRRSNRHIIDINNYDGNIDLSPCIGIYAESCYFERYDLYENLIAAQEYSKDFHITPKSNSPEDIILAITALMTKQSRYVKQVNPPFVSEDKQKEISERLSTVFTGKEEVQRDVTLDFMGSNHQTYAIHGRCDVIKDNAVVELKFTGSLKDTYYLQTAVYICLLGFKKGYLWDVKNNEMYRVTVPDRQAFMKAVVKSITKHNVSAIGKFNIPKPPMSLITRDNEVSENEANYVSL